MRSAEPGHQPSIWPRLLLVLLILASLAATWAFVIVSSFSERDAMMKEAADEVSRMSQVVAEQTAGLMEEIKVYLVLLDTWIADNPGRDPRTDFGFAHLVDGLRKNARFRLDVRFVSETGGLFYVPTKDLSKPLAEVGDREYFAAQKLPATQGFFIAGPVLSRVTNIWGIPISYPLSRHEAGLAVIFAAVELPLLNDLFEGARPKPDGAITLVRSDGILLCRAPFVAKDMGRNVSEDPGWLSRAEGAQFGQSPLDSRKKIVAFRNVAGFPLVVSVSVDESRISGPWRSSMLPRFGFLSLGSIIILAMGYYVLRSWRLLEASSRERLALNAELGLKVEEVRRQLAEKDILIRETNHRVKNHMAQLVSLVNLTEGSVGPGQARGEGGGGGELLESLRARIYGYSLLYEKLSYQADEAGQLDLSDYVEDLLFHLIEISGSEGPVRRSVDVESIPVLAKTCSTLGLILSELVTNSLKHARREGEELSISVKIRGSQGRIQLSYADNGPGFDYAGLHSDASSGGLGMVLIDTMLGQYGGSLSYSREGGSRFEITL